jgi:hypothetical protein
VVVLLYHSQSLHLGKQFAEIKIPNMKSSGGVFQYGTGIKSGRTDETYFLIDQLKLVGQQLNDLLMWLIMRVQGEQEAQTNVTFILSKAQELIDAKLEEKAAEKEKKAQQDKGGVPTDTDSAVRLI